MKKRSIFVKKSKPFKNKYGTTVIRRPHERRIEDKRISKEKVINVKQGSPIFLKNDPEMKIISRVYNLQEKFSIYNNDPDLIMNLNDKIGRKDEDIVDIVNSVDVNGYMMIKFKNGEEWWIYEEGSYEDELESLYRDELVTTGLTGMNNWKDLIDKKDLLEDVLDTIEHNYYAYEGGTEEEWEEMEEGIIEETQANVFFEADRVMSFHHKSGEKNEIDSYYSQFVTDEKRKKYMEENALGLFEGHEKLNIADCVAIKTK